MSRSFLWGSATSAHQVEGYNQHSDWWHWEKLGHIEGGATSGAATDHWNRVEEDLNLAASMGLNTYRFSIEWAKIEPSQGEWNQEAIQWYLSLLDQCEKKNLLPMLTLHHFTLPQWVAERGGYSSPDSVGYFIKFVEKVIELMGPRIPLWCTFNEPMVLVTGSYLGGFMPPAKHAPKLVGIASKNILMAHGIAYDLIHSISSREGPWRDWPIEVGIAHNMLDFLPDRWWHPIENILARLVHGFYNLSWLDAVTGKKQHFGIRGVVPFSVQVNELRGRCSVDFLGVNYYTKAYMKWRPRDASAETLSTMPIGLAFARRTEEQSDMGWAVHPAGFRKVLKTAARYGLPLYVTENGIADREDKIRPKFLAQHLREVGRLIEEGVDIRGFYYWSLMDNFEWIKGFGPRFGLVHVDYSTFQRKEKFSAKRYREIISAHGGVRPPDPNLLDSFCSD